LPGVYLHIPFCLSKCGYCDFVSAPAPPSAIERYVRALEREIRSSPEAGRPAGSLFLGGGTPSLLAEDQLARLLAAVRETFGLVPGAEVSIEANPGTVTAAKARRLVALGVTRVSLGVQSLDDDLLRRLGRHHTAAEALAAFAALREAGCGNLGLDLIHSLPGQTPAAFERDLARVIALGPEHLSLYALSVEEGTPFAAALARGALALPTEEEELAMLETARALTAAAGYEHYEISSFARPGRRCAHNMVYWTMGAYAGFGAGAHSFDPGPPPVRRANTADAAAYVRRVEAGETAAASRETLSAAALAGETLMLGLRTADGVATDAFAQRFGAPPGALFPEALALGAERGWLAAADGRLRLTATGVLFSNEIFRRLF
jgi:oxygen-independent coproporphyrinogen-3 oxidase